MDVDLPYIFRKDGKYCAAKIVESQLLKKYELILHRDVFSCAKTKCWQMNPIEFQLLNEINLWHCDALYGNSYFTDTDILIKLDDVWEFYKFLSLCHRKLTSAANDMSKCGFIKINAEAIVPYTIVGSVTYLPLFYFEGEVDDVKPFAIKLIEWDLAYMKFCCKTQGIKNSLYDHDYCDVVDLQTIKKYFPSSAKFEYYWPTKIASELLISNSIFIKPK